MKRVVLLVAAVVLLGASIPSFAQQAGGTPPAGAAQPADTTSQYPKDVYYKVVQLVKVWLGTQGYKVQFFNSRYQLQDIYVPLAWFNNGPSSKADIVYTLGAGIPYMTIFWADGKFDHVTLYVSSNDSDQSNGVLSEDQNTAAQFNVQEVPRNF